jgi:hypothetical protein
LPPSAQLLLSDENKKLKGYYSYSYHYYHYSKLKFAFICIIALLKASVAKYEEEKACTRQLRSELSAKELACEKHLSTVDSIRRKLKEEKVRFT